MPTRANSTAILTGDFLRWAKKVCKIQKKKVSPSFKKNKKKKKLKFF